MVTQLTTLAALREMPAKLAEALRENPKCRELRILQNNLQKPKITAYPREEVVQVLKRKVADFVYSASIKTGLTGAEKMDTKERELHTNEVLGLLLDYRSRLTLEEIDYVLQEGLRGNLGGPDAGEWRTFGISARSVNMWLKQYWQEELAKARKAKQALFEEEKAPDTTDYGLETFGEWLKECQQIAESLSGKVADLEPISTDDIRLDPHQEFSWKIVYDHLKREAILSAPAEEAKAIYAEELPKAKALLLAMKQHKGDRNGYQRISQIDLGQAIDTEITTLALRKSKVRWLKGYIARLIQTEEPIAEHFNQLYHARSQSS